MSLGAAWAISIVPWALESTVVGLVLLAVLRAAPRLSPGARVGLTSLGLAKMLLPPVLLPVGLLSLGVADASGSAAPLGRPLAEAILPAAALAGLAAVHLAGVLAGAGLLVYRASHVSRLRRRAVLLTEGPVVALTRDVARRLGCRVPAVRVSEGCPVPFVVGAWAPTVLLPARLVRELGPAELGAILAHELAHLRSGDLWLGWLRALAGVLWWPSPAARGLARLQAAAMEERCDDLVVQTGVASPSLYARTLVAAAEVAVHERTPAFAAAATGTLGLEQRLRRLAVRRLPGRRLPVRLLLAALTLLLLPATFSGAVSRLGWTTQVLFQHPADAGADTAAPSHRHSHVHDHRR